METSNPLCTSGDYLETIKRGDGYYEAVRDAQGKFLTPIILTGSYEVRSGSRVFGSYLSLIHYNLAPLEQNPHVVNHFSIALRDKVVEQLGNRQKSGDKTIDRLVVIPQTEFGIILAYHLGCGHAKPEKQVVRPATDHQLAQYELVFRRHRLERGQQVAIFDDVGNNFTGVYKLLTLLGQLHCQLVAVICIVNRSHQRCLPLPCYGDVPIISLLHRPTLQYRQDDPLVAAEFSKGNVEGDPKGSWYRLLAAMNQHSPTPA